MVKQYVAWKYEIYFITFLVSSENELVFTYITLRKYLGRKAIEFAALKSVTLTPYMSKVIMKIPAPINYLTLFRKIDTSLVKFLIMKTMKNFASN